MYLSTLSLENFRSYERKTFRFGTNTTLLVGNNAMGKTNVLEAIFLLATGRSFRAQRTEEMILFTKELARVTGKVDQLSTATDVDAGPSVELEVLLTRGELQGKRV